MKILQKYEGKDRACFYPYLIDDDLTVYNYPIEILDFLKVNRDFFKSKDAVKKVFSDGMELFLVNIGKKDAVSFEVVREYANICYKTASSELIKNFNLRIYPGLWQLDKECVYSSTMESLLLSGYSYNVFKKVDGIKFTIDEVCIVSDVKIDRESDQINRVEIVSKSVVRARDLINGPANLVDIEYFQNEVKKVVDDNGLAFEVFNHEDLAKMNMNLLLAVGQAALQPPRLLKITYTHKTPKKKIILAGKGIIFDTGGLHIKTETFMDHMKCDMGGAAVVLSVIESVSKLALPVELIVLIPLAENSVDAASYHPGDIIVGHKGKSVEILSTDAEGRLILADTLSYADTLGADIVLDVATLTGAVRIALGTKIAAGYFRNDELRNNVIASSDRTGEAIWPMPLYEPYKKNLKSPVADLGNLGVPFREAGSVTAALFLGEFVDNNNWAHLDIASVSFADNENYYIPKGGTGVPVRTLVDYIEHI